jgi:hypothetical protein
MSKKQDKLFVVVKYIWAKDIAAALKEEKSIVPEGIYLDDKWRENNYGANATSGVGFELPKKDADE